MKFQATSAVQTTADPEPDLATRQEIHIVGDKFIDYARENPNVMTTKEFEQLLDGGVLSGPLDVRIAQGVAVERLAQLEERLERSPLRNAIRIVEARPRRRASGKLTHKHFDKNTIISTPTRMEGKELYEAHLILDDDCAEVSDHLTGQHIQGIVFYEAARQMFLAVTEAFFLNSGKPGRKYYFVINQFDLTYHTFGFPLPMDIHLEVNELRGDSRGTDAMFMDVQIYFYQAGVNITESRVKYAVFEKAVLSAREGLLARLALTKVVPTMTPLPGWEV